MRCSVPLPGHLDARPCFQQVWDQREVQEAGFAEKGAIVQEEETGFGGTRLHSRNEKHELRIPE